MAHGPLVHSKYRIHSWKLIWEVTTTYFLQNLVYCSKYSYFVCLGTCLFRSNVTKSSVSQTAKSDSNVSHVITVIKDNTN